MARNAQQQYTIRSVPSTVDRALREQARREGKSLNQVAVEALRRGVGLAAAEATFDDLDDLVDTWQDDPEFDAALKRQDAVDRKLWR
ncbi:MAG: hypothetical protein IID40_03835 [Planctomycetes bacterium]|nr:hypothetical protein [Planctomycetota bacterium]